MVDLDFLLLTQPRSGTHILTSYLKNHDELCWLDNEPCYSLLKSLNGKKITNYCDIKADQKLFVRYFDLYLNSLFQKNNKNNMQKGITAHIMDVIRLDYLNFILSRKKIKIILLYRKNLLSRYLSREIQLKTEINVNQISTLKLNVNFNDFLDDVKYVMAERDAIEKHINNRTDKLLLYYEDLVDNPKLELKKIKDFLSLKKDFTNLELEWFKQETREFKDIIINYNDFFNRIKDTEYAYLLDK